MVVAISVPKAGSCLVAGRPSHNWACSPTCSVPQFGAPNKPFDNTNNRFTELSAGDKNSMPRPLITGVWSVSVTNTRPTNFGRVAVFLCVCSTYAIVCTGIELRPGPQLGPVFAQVLPCNMARTICSAGLPYTCRMAFHSAFFPSSRIAIDAGVLSGASRGFALPAHFRRARGAVVRISLGLFLACPEPAAAGMRTVGPFALLLATTIIPLVQFTRPFI